MNRQSELEQSYAEVTTVADVVDYRRITPRISFGSGGNVLLDRLYGYEDRSSLHAQSTDTQLVASTGWIALETAAHFAQNDIRRGFYVNRAVSRFEIGEQLMNSTDARERLLATRARLGSIAAYAYSASSLSTVVDDLPGLYSDILKDLFNETKHDAQTTQNRRGYISELSFATLASSLGYLTLPASIRHNNPINNQFPSFTHDFLVWKTIPDALPAKPDHHMQINSRLHQQKPNKYSKKITLLAIESLAGADMDQLSKAMTIYYDGKAISKQSVQLIREASKHVDALLQQDAGDDIYGMKGGAMRGGRKGRETSLYIAPSAT